MTSVQQEYSEQHRLRLDWNNPDAGISKLAHVTQTPKGFDFPTDHWPEAFHHAGPLHDPNGRMAVDFPWERLTGEPTVYASMGTLQNGSEGVFRAIVEGAGGLGVISAGCANGSYPNH